MKTKINYLSALFVIVLLLGNTMVKAQIVGFQFGSPKTNGNEANVTASLVQPGLKVTQLQRGAGLYTISEGGLVRGFVSLTKIATTDNLADTAIAVVNDMYFKFDVTVNKNYKASFANLNYKIRASGGGAKVYYWKYSTDGKTFKKLAEPAKIVPVGAEGQTMPQIELASIKDLQNVAEGTTISFRLYTNGSNATTGTTAIGRSAAATSNDYAIVLGGKVEQK